MHISNKLIHSTKPSETPISPQESADFAEAILERGQSLAADRSTTTRAMVIAHTLFWYAVVNAIIQMTSSKSHVGLQVNAIASSALLFFIVPLSLLTALIGTVNTEGNTREKLQKLQNEINRVCHTKMSELSLPSWSEQVPFEKLMLSGSCSLWQPKNRMSIRDRPLLEQIFLCSVFFVIIFGGITTAIIETHLVPPGGWQARHWFYLSVFFTYMCSPILEYILDRTFGPRFWIIFAKDSMIAVAVCTPIILAQLGLFNRPVAWSLGPHDGVATPEIPFVDDQVYHLFTNGDYPITMVASITIQFVMVLLLVVTRYGSAVRVFLQ